jgi:hypothetical protein
MPAEVPLRSRVRRAAVFVALVWGVAATFIGFELAATRGLDLMLDYPRVFEPLLLSRSTRESTACAVGADETPRTRNAALSTADARAASWMLGVRVGHDAQARMSTTVTRDVLDQSAEAVAQLSRLLGAPAPAPFVPVRIINSNTEFRERVDRDPDATAHTLAVNYSPESCQLYKLGALWGYATLARFALGGERAVFEAELRYHATRAGLPDEVWRPMVARIPADSTAEAINQESQAITGRVTEHLMKSGG